MKRLLLLLLITPGAAFAQSVTPNFTTGTMTQTVTATQTVTETSITQSGLAVIITPGTVTMWSQ